MKKTFTEWIQPLADMPVGRVWWELHQRRTVPELEATLKAMDQVTSSNCGCDVWDATQVLRPWVESALAFRIHKRDLQ